MPMRNHLFESPLTGVPLAGKAYSPCITPRNGIGNRGFTLIELLAVTAVLSILATMALSAFYSYVSLAKITRATTDIRNIDKSINAFVIDRATLPNDLSELGPVPLDPWGRQYKYYNFAKGGDTPYMDVTGVTQLNREYDLYSLGKDGLTDKSLMLSDVNSRDDIIRGNDGTVIELGEKF